MRRFSATFLLVWLGFLLIGPAVFAASDSQLPECCRRLGKHRCAIAGGADSQSATASLRTITDRCPYFPAGPAVPVYPYHALLNASRMALNSPPAVSVRSAQTFVAARNVLRHAHQKRGPPAC